MDNKKKILSMIALSLFLMSILSFGTYALFNVDILTDNNSITTGQVKMNYTESNEIGMNNALPMKDSEGKKLTNYFDFQVLSYIKTRANDSVKRKINYNIVLEPITVDNPLNDNEIKVYLTKVESGEETVVVEPTTIDKLTNYILDSHEEIFSNNKREVVTSYRLRAWIDESFDTNKLNEKSYSYRFRVNVNSSDVTSSIIPVPLDESGANAPELTSNMIPVYYDEANDTWKKADNANKDKNNQWYDYDKKMWANAVTVTETNRDAYLKASAGTEIPMSDINTMWVWIPRYTYTYLNTNTPEEIQIKFESGTNSSGTIRCVDNVSASGATSETCTDSINGSLKAGTSTYTHPAFTFGGQELTGIWVGKFENSATIIPEYTSTIDSTIIIKPSVNSLKSKDISYMFKDVRQMELFNNIYGFEQSSKVVFNWSGELTGDTNNIDTHMMKNMEWGAVTYLSHSKYGINKEVAINSSSTFTTGCGPQSNGSTSYGSKCNAYNTTLGQSASTTGNIYGVYDMNGGMWEYVMANMVGTSNRFNPESATGWTDVNPLPKYYDSYTYDVNSDTSYTRGKLGDATKEMAPTGEKGNWYDDNAIFVYRSYPWFMRGGDYNGGTNSGVFSFYDSLGNGSYNYSSRTTLTIQ